MRAIINDINHDKFMIMEYLSPVVDGCKAAFNVSLEKAQELHSLSDSDFEAYLHSDEQSFRELGICFHATDVDEKISIVFDNGYAQVYDECIEPDVIISASLRTLVSLLDADPGLSPPEILGTHLTVDGTSVKEVVEGLGLLCYPSLLRMARSGIDPSSLLAEDADSIIMAAASDMVTKMIRKWVDLKLEVEE